MIPSDSMEKKTVDLIIGKKVHDTGQEKRREVQGSPVPVDAYGGGEVAGRAGMAYITCPYDQAINYVWVDDYRLIWYRCWHCHGLFSA
jgi:hypothetical protein